MDKINTDITVERIVLASIVSSYDGFMNVLSFVSDEDFFIPFNIAGIKKYSQGIGRK